MRRHTALLTLALCLLGSASTCAPSRGQPSIAADPAKVAGRRPLLRDTILSQKEQSTIEQKRLRAVGTCLNKAGFEVQLPDFAALDRGISIDSTLDVLRYGIESTDSAKSLGVADFLASSATIDLSVRANRDYGPAFQNALFGTDRSGTIDIPSANGKLQARADGCIGSSYLTVFRTVENIGRYLEFPAIIQSDVNAKVDEDGDVIAATQVWRGCTRRTGEEHESPAAAITYLMDVFAKSGKNKAISADQKLAQLFKKCEKESSLFATALKAQDLVEKRITEARQADLSTFADLVATASTVG